MVPASKGAGELQTFFLGCYRISRVAAPQNCLYSCEKCTEDEPRFQIGIHVARSGVLWEKGSQFPGKKNSFYQLSTLGTLVFAGGWSKRPILANPTPGRTPSTRFLQPIFLCLPVLAPPPSCAGPSKPHPQTRQSIHRSKIHIIEKGYFPCQTHQSRFSIPKKDIWDLRNFLFFLCIWTHLDALPP